MRSHRTKAILRFSDLDVLGHVNSLSLAELVEDGRMQLLASLPMTEATDLVLLSLKLEYRAPAKPYATYCVNSEIKAIGRSSITLSHSIVEEAAGNELVVEAESIVVHVDRQTRKSIPLDAGQRSTLE